MLQLIARALPRVREGGSYRRCSISEKNYRDAAIFDEDAIYYIEAIRISSAPKTTMLPTFRQLIEAKELTRKIFGTVNGHFAERALMMSARTIVQTTLSAAPQSTKNKQGKRHPAMHVELWFVQRYWPPRTLFWNFFCPSVTYVRNIPIGSSYYFLTGVERSIFLIDKLLFCLTLRTCCKVRGPQKPLKILVEFKKIDNT